VSPTNARPRVALVTGANRGLGFETSRQLFAQGLNVALAGRDDDSLERAFRSLGQDDERAMTVRMDVTDVASIERAQRAVAERFGRVDILVNNAAVLLFEDEDVLSIPADAYQSTFDTNVFGAIEVCRVFVPPMARAGYGWRTRIETAACWSTPSIQDGYGRTWAARRHPGRRRRAPTRSSGSRRCLPKVPPADSSATGARSSGS
jgi:NAD(P)-dependent dehydrogenase (short-subunit alcohol dehydrogenase family)